MTERPPRTWARSNPVRVLLIDADSEAFAASAAAEQKRYVGLLEGEDPQGLPRVIGPFDGKRKLMAALPEGATCTPYESRTVSLLDQATGFFDARIRRVIAAAEERYGKVRPELYLSGRVNFRHLIDAGYKWARERTERPYHLHAVRQHAIDQWSAKVALLWEADDEIGMRATELTLAGVDYCVSSLDKDLRQIPGRHLVLEQSGVKGHLEVTDRGALFRLYSQILMGDSTDNIPVCLMSGYDVAFTLLEPIVDSGPLALWEAVVARYQASLDRYGREKCGYLDARAAAIHTAQLVYIQRHRPEGTNLPARWVPPDVERPTPDEVADLEGT
jgi:hypothetical protein